MWEVVIGVWYKNLKDGEVVRQSVVHTPFGLVHLAAKWPDGWTNNGVVKQPKSKVTKRML